MTKDEAVFRLEDELTEAQLAVWKAQAATALIHDEMFEKIENYKSAPYLCLQSIEYLRPFMFMLMDELNDTMKILDSLIGSVVLEG